MNQNMLQLLAVQQWFYREARILDARRYDLWLEQLDERIRYRIPSRGYVCAGNVEDFSTWAVGRELDLPDSLPLIDDDFTSLRERVGRLQSGMAWAEIPPSITRRIVSNIEILDRDSQGRLRAISTTLLNKVRNDESVVYTAQRRDRLLPAGDDFRLQDRYVVLDSVVLASGNLSILF